MCVLDNTLVKLTNAERGYMIESIWKYLIYTELLKSIYGEIKQYPSHWEFDNAEKDVIEFVENKKTIILPDFSVRLESIMENLSGVKSIQNGSKKEYQLKVSELLHNNIINKLRSIIGSYCSKKEKIVILIDNLDKAWQAGANLKTSESYCSFGKTKTGFIKPIIMGLTASSYSITHTVRLICNSRLSRNIWLKIHVSFINLPLFITCRL